MTALGANLLANGLGVGVVRLVAAWPVAPEPAAVQEVMAFSNVTVTPAAFLLGFVLTWRYFLPLGRTLDRLRSDEAVSEIRLQEARRRALNAPYFCMMVDAAIWVSVAVAHGVMLAAADAASHFMVRAVMQDLLIGATTVTAAFFLVEQAARISFTPRLFLHGALRDTPGALRTRLWGRLGALLAVANVIPLTALFLIALGSTEARELAMGSDRDMFERFAATVRAHAALFIVLGAGVALLVVKSILTPLRDVVAVLEDVRRGVLGTRAPLRANDELGYAAETVNAMVDGLVERDRMKASLELARQVQLAFAPREAPTLPGWAIAGAFRTCDEIGGDFYDLFLRAEGVCECAVTDPTAHPPAARRLMAVVGDVTGHGAPAALLMAGARGALRQRLALPGGLDTSMADVNVRLCEDVGDSGAFMTCLLMECRMDGRLAWVRAGHDPAVVYSPDEDAFRELRGEGLALGVLPEQAFPACHDRLRPGEVVVLATDGVWETRDARGEFFGRRRFREVVRRNARHGVEAVCAGTLEALETFREGVAQDDDVTLVALQFTG